VKTLEQILSDNPAFYPDASTDTRKMRFMFLLENGSLIGAEGQNHFALLGGESKIEEPTEIEKLFCEQNKALRLCFESYSEKSNGARGEFWCVYVETFKDLPSEAQWATLGNLYNLKDRQNTHFKWDVLTPEIKRGWLRGEGSLSDFRRVLYPPPAIVVSKKERKPTRRKSRRPIKSKRARASCAPRPN
jgi:hypothetical protein